MIFSKISDEQYEQLTQNCTVLKTRRGKPAILQTTDGMIIKHIYYRKGFSSSRIWPYAVRFIKNSIRLKDRGFIVPTIEQAFRASVFNCDILVYPMIEGKSVRIHSNENNDEPLRKLPRFLATLHQSGVYFRDLHLDNIIVCGGDFALIDLASVQCKRKPLNASQRKRNFEHLFNNEDDKDILDAYGREMFMKDYDEVLSQL